jgi:beta-lactamase regulating signal transducer with metallopeptidase domain
VTDAIVQSLNRAAQAWWPFALHTTWTSCLVAVVLLLMVRLGRRWPAKVRHAILVIALVKFALPPTLALPVGLFHWFGPEVVQHASVSATGVTGTVSIAGWDDLSFKAWVFVVYSWGTIAASIMIVRQMFRVRRIVRGATVVTSGPVYERFRRLSKRLGIRRPIRLLASGRPVAPMAFGLLRPSILTPMSVHNRLPGGEVETVLAHELAHHRRGDLWLNWFQILLRIAWWFNPVLRVLNRAIRQAGEDCCDDLLLAGRVTTGEGYCQALLRVAKELGRQPMMGGALGFAESIHPLSQRMRRLMDPNLKHSDRIPLAAFAPMILIAAMVLPGLPSKANSSIPILATESSDPGLLARNDADFPLTTGKSSPAKTTLDVDLADSMVRPFMTSPTQPVYRYPAPDQLDNPYSAPEGAALADGRDEGNIADPVDALRTEATFAVGEPISTPEGLWGAETRLTTGSRGNWRRWVSSESTATAWISTPPSGDPEPQPQQQQNMEKQQQYADGSDEDPQPIKMPSLPGGDDENIPGVEKLRSPASESRTPQLADRSTKQLLQADEYENILAALTPSNRLNRSGLPRGDDSLDDVLFEKLSDKLTDYFDDGLALNPTSKYDDIPLPLVSEPIALADLPDLNEPNPKDLITSMSKPETDDPRSEKETPLYSYLPDSLSPPAPGYPCLTPEPISLLTLGLGFTLLLRRRKA